MDKLSLQISKATIDALIAAIVAMANATLPFPMAVASRPRNADRQARRVAHSAS
jgi:hypothetical protein